MVSSHKFDMPDYASLQEKAQSKFDTLDSFLWPGGQVEKPPTNKNYLRLYSHNLCPFAAKARNALAAKGIEF